MSFRARGSLDAFYVGIFGSLDGEPIDDPNTLDKIAGIVPLAQVEFLLENNDFFQCENGDTFELEDSI